MSTAQVVDRDELLARRQRLLDRVGKNLQQLQEGAEDFTLTDDERSVYDTVLGIDWLLGDE